MTLPDIRPIVAAAFRLFAAAVTRPNSPQRVTPICAPATDRPARRSTLSREQQEIADRLSAQLRAAFFNDDGTPVTHNDPKDS